MRKIINDPRKHRRGDDEGLIAVYHHMYYKHPESKQCDQPMQKKNKVSLIIGGGSGH